MDSLTASESPTGAIFVSLSASCGTVGLIMYAGRLPLPSGPYGFLCPLILIGASISFLLLAINEDFFFEYPPDEEDPS